MNNFESVRKVFQLRFSSGLLGKSPLWSLLGFQSEWVKDPQSCAFQLIRAAKGEYDTVLFPALILQTSIWAELKTLIQKYDFKVLVAVDADFPQENEAKAAVSEFHRWSFIRILDCTNSQPSPFFKKPGDFVWVLGSKFIENHVALIEESYVPDRMFFYFPYAGTNTSVFPGIVELHELTMLLQDKIGRLMALPGVNVFDHRAGDERETNPCYECERLTTALNGDQTIISVIIPTYNNKIYLSNVIRHLCYQDFEAEHFEVIIVDDGSTDNTRQYILDHLPTDRLINLRYIFFPRFMDRKMGDGQFRAGIARNLGVQHAKGDILAFLDSDVLIPSDYLSRVCEEHKFVDVTQARRVELKKELSSGQTLYRNILPKRDTYINDTGYWQDFLFSGKPWSYWPDGWKYTCTHSLTVKTKAFKDFGWFRTAFLFYGYEDTDLGHRLWRGDQLFKLLDTMVYHLHHADTRSEYDNSQEKKMALLAKSAEIFYQNTLDHEIYNHCKYHFVKPLIERMTGAKVPWFVWRFKSRFNIYAYRVPSFVWLEKAWHRCFGYAIRRSHSLKFMMSKFFWSSIALVTGPLKKMIKGLRRE